MGMPCKGLITVVASPIAGRPWLNTASAMALRRVANRPILAHVLDALAAAGVQEMAILAPTEVMQEIVLWATSERADQDLHFIEQAPRAERGATRAALARFAGDSPLVVHRANGLLGQPLAPYVDLLDEEPTGIVLLITQRARNSERLGSAVREVLRVTELDPDNATLGLAGVCVLAPGAFADPSLDSPEVDFEALVESQIQHGSGRVQVRLVHDDWRAFAGQPLDLLDLNRAVLDSLPAQPSAAGVADGNRVEGRVVIHPTAAVSSSVICGPAIIGAGACISDSYIGPHTSIGERVHMEGAEIERSIVLDGASILHVGGRLVASVVGREARVFRDFSMPRAMRLQVGDGDEVALC